jgi:hypothetical protein
MRIVIRPALVACVAALLVSAGCSGDGLRRAAVSGQVLVDNEPLAEGSIAFFPTDGNSGPESGAVIKDGKYSIPASTGVIVGKNKVEIRGFRKSGRKVPDIMEKTKMVDEMISALPATYNDQTTLVHEVRDGNNTINFELTGVKK